MMLSTATQEDPQCRAATRPWRSKIDIRLATSQDQEPVARLVSEAGFSILDGMDMSELYPHWLVAVVDGEVVGCIQVIPAKPVGFIDFMAVDESVGDKMRVRVLKKFEAQAYATLKTAGCQAVGYFIPFELKSYKRILKKRSAVVIASGNMMTRFV